MLYSDCTRDSAKLGEYADELHIILCLASPQPQQADQARDCL
jgi:hypothetical protein